MARAAVDEKKLDGPFKTLQTVTLGLKVPVEAQIGRQITGCDLGLKEQSLEWCDKGMTRIGLYILLV